MGLVNLKKLNKGKKVQNLANNIIVCQNLQFFAKATLEVQMSIR